MKAIEFITDCRIPARTKLWVSEFKDLQEIFEAISGTTTVRYIVIDGLKSPEYPINQEIADLWEFTLCQK